MSMYDPGINRAKGSKQMKTVMGWIDKIVSALARRKVDKDEGRSK